MGQLSSLNFFTVDPYFGLTFLTEKKTYPLLAHISNFDHDGDSVGSQKISNMDLGWVKSMPGDFGEFTVNIGLGINFLNSNDTLSYIFKCFLDLCSLRACLDLAVFPQISQGCATPVIWLASMCFTTKDLGAS